MPNNIEKEKVNKLSYLPISNRKINEALKGKSEKEIKELGVSEIVLFMISMGYGNQLREDVYQRLSSALNVDISLDDPHTAETIIN